MRKDKNYIPLAGIVRERCQNIGRLDRKSHLRKRVKTSGVGINYEGRDALLAFAEKVCTIGDFLDMTIKRLFTDMYIYIL